MPRFIIIGRGMSMSEEIRPYRTDRVLIESDRILSPQFHDAVVFLSGAQIELLRNMTQYLNRLDTYVSEYKSDHYLTPDVSDFDDILAIVADLEETLMGNPNTIWGYEERLNIHFTYERVGDGDASLNIFTVPEGYVYVVTAAMSKNDATAVTQTHFLNAAGEFYDVKVFENQPADEWAINPGINYALKEGDKYTIRFDACLNGDDLRGRAWGYRMKVPD